MTREQATKKQIEFAEYLAYRMSVELPQEKTKKGVFRVYSEMEICRTA